VTPLVETFDPYTHIWDSYYSNNTVLSRDGKLYLESTRGGMVGIAICLDCMNFGQTFYYQAELLPEKDTYIQYGLAFCINADRDRYYNFLLSTKNSNFTLYKYHGGSWQSLIPNGSSSSILEYPASNTLAVNFEGGHMSLYINNTLVTTYEDPQPVECNQSGIFIDDAYVELGADNIYMYNVPAPASPTP
jgi:hypothetical protein